ncbi:hypothetical protein LTR12_002901 [Friedmanniomyces endolithicus]|nr:hypothetical protein LTR74_008833 [Friedmanniomyces endolithicus]KAK1822762.1 hypothetical protein LTR12_002901 [Friedmanniomyces endolithicus]
MNESPDGALRDAATSQPKPPTPAEARPLLDPVDSHATPHDPHEEGASPKSSRRRPRSLSRNSSRSMRAADDTRTDEAYPEAPRRRLRSRSRRHARSTSPRSLRSMRAAAERERSVEVVVNDSPPRPRRRSRSLSASESYLRLDDIGSAPKIPATDSADPSTEIEPSTETDAGAVPPVPPIGISHAPRRETEPVYPAVEEGREAAFHLNIVASQSLATAVAPRSALSNGWHRVLALVSNDDTQLRPAQPNTDLESSLPVLNWIYDPTAPEIATWATHLEIALSDPDKAELYGTTSATLLAVFAALVSLLMNHEPLKYRVAATDQPGRLKVKHLLQHLYLTEVLPAPNEGTDAERDVKHRQHLTILAHVMSCANIWIKLRETETGHLHNQFGHRRTTNTIANLPLRDVLLGDFNTRAKQASIASTTRSRRFRKYETFMSDDLDIGSLQGICDLEIEITMYAEEHLELVLGGSEHDDASEEYSDDLAESKVTGRPTRKIYWFDSYKLHQLGAELGDVIDANVHVHSYDMQQHLNPSLRKYNATKRGVYAYGLFPTSQNRIYHLREYMDKKKPRGLMQLWKDNRDSLNYYTFWGVIIFGIASVVLASLSLVAGVVQTWASVKALQVASNSSPAVSTSS